MMMIIITDTVKKIVIIRKTEKFKKITSYIF